MEGNVPFALKQTLPLPLELCARAGDFPLASLSAPLGPLPDPSKPRPQKHRLPVAVERARVQTGAHPSLTQETSKGSRKQRAWLTPASRRSPESAEPGAPWLGIFHPIRIFAGHPDSGL